MVLSWRLFLCLMFGHQGNTSKPCPSLPVCICDQKYRFAKCVNTNLRRIPKFPSYVTRVSFQGNLLENINSSTFENLEKLNLRSLSLQNNSIMNITPDAFKYLPHLKTLDLSKNPKIQSSNLASAIAEIKSQNMTSLYLNYLYWDNEPVELYKSLSQFRIKELHLRGSNIKHFNTNVLSIAMPRLEILDLSSGRISTINQSLFQYLSKLRIHDNYLDLQKGYFGNETHCFFPNLIQLNLRNNLINYFEGRFSCLNKLQFLLLDQNPVKEIKNDTFLLLPSLKTLHLRRMGNRLNTLESFAFRSRSLRKLDFAENKFNFRETTLFPMFWDKNNIFRGIPNLQNLDLSGNTFDLETDVLQHMLLPIPALKRLRLNDCTLKSTPTHLLYKIPTLEFLSLSENKISSWDGYEVFGNRTSLKMLSLSNNLITIVNKTMFPFNAIQNLSTINLVNNPFSCTCGNLWFRNWINQDLNRFDNFPSFYICKSPASRENTLLLNYNPTVEECSGQYNKIFTSVVTSVSVVGITAVILVSFIYRLRWHIRYWMYLSRVKRKGFSMVTEEPTNYLYDAFVIYCDEDRKWVHQRLIQRLEKTDCRLNLCIHHRDFEAGKLIVDNIAEKMSASKKILLIISRDMVRSDWCLFEIRIAQEKYLNKETDAMISIMLEDVPKEEMTGSLRTLLNYVTYIQWPKKQYEEERFWKKITLFMQQE